MKWIDILEKKKFYIKGSDYSRLIENGQPIPQFSPEFLKKKEKFVGKKILSRKISKKICQHR